jgi:hypothetical protein
MKAPGVEATISSALHALRALGEHELGAVGREELAPLDRKGLGHREDDPVALGGGHRREGDAGVAARRLDDDRAGLELAGALSVLDHGQSDSILHAREGIEGFELAQEGDARLRPQCPKLHEGRVADEVGDPFRVCHFDMLLSLRRCRSHREHPR